MLPGQTKAREKTCHIGVYKSDFRETDMKESLGSGSERSTDDDQELPSLKNFVSISSHRRARPSVV